MVAIVHQKDKRSGITYAYRSESYWDKEKKQSRARRTLIGRVDEITGEIVPTDGRNRKKKGKQGPAKTNNAEVDERSFYGATYLLDFIGEQLGITEDLKKCFPKTCEQILSLVYFLVLENSAPLSRFEKWGTLHKHPCGRDITSERISELFASITEVNKQHFFTLRGKRRTENEFWAYDTSTISSYSETINKDQLPQMYLFLLFEQGSNLPCYYRKLSGNIPDSGTVSHLLDDLESSGYSNVKLVAGRGFYGEGNINGLYKDHIKFLIPAKNSSLFVWKELDEIYDTFRSFEHLSISYGLYHRTVRTNWNYTQKRPKKGDTIRESRRIYIHYYYNLEKAVEDEVAFDRQMIASKKELEAGKRIPQHEKFYQEYFTIRTTPGSVAQISINEEKVREAKRYFGFFALISNETMDAITALEIYRNKDVTEKAFGNVKERLNMRHSLVSSEKSFEGKLFVQFIALIYLSYIKRQMQINDLFKDHTLESLLDKLDIIECFEQPDKSLRVGEISEIQKELYHYMGVTLPDSM